MVVAQLVEWVASNTRGPRFESNHQQKLYWTFIQCYLYLKDIKNKEKEAGMAIHLKNIISFSSLSIVIGFIFWQTMDQPLPHCVIFCSFQIKIYRKWSSSVGFELGSSEFKASSMTSWPLPKHVCVTEDRIEVTPLNLVPKIQNNQFLCITYRRLFIHLSLSCHLVILIFKMPNSRPLLHLFDQFLSNKNVDFSDIQIWIFGVKGKYADHLSSTAAFAILLSSKSLSGMYLCLQNA